MFANADGSVAKVIRQCISDWHPNLMDASFAVLFNDKTPLSGGKLVAGRAQVVSENSVWKPLLDHDVNFVLWVSKDVWDGLSPSDRVPFIDSILCSCQYDAKEGRASIVRPDFEGFYAVIRRHGIWNDALRKSLDAKTENTFVQTRIFEDEPMVFNDLLNNDEEQDDEP